MGVAPPGLGSVCMLSLASGAGGTNCLSNLPAQAVQFRKVSQSICVQAVYLTPLRGYRRLPGVRPRPLYNIIYPLAPSSPWLGKGVAPSQGTGPILRFYQPAYRDDLDWSGLDLARTKSWVSSQSWRGA